MGLLRLPDEVVDVVFKALLPPFKSQSLAETYAFSVPTDLLAARLVCRHFYGIATPFAWRRVQLQIASPAVKSYGSLDLAGPSLAANRHSQRSLARCRFFEHHRHLAACVRVLLVNLEWYAEHPELARDALRAATHAMDGLRTVLIWDADVLPFSDIRALFERPLLRAVRLMDVDCSVFPTAAGDWAAGLTMLHIANSACPARLVAGAASSLECLSIELARTCPAVQGAATLRDMPWATLREVAIVDCVDNDDWSFFLEGFEIHKRLCLPLTLEELIIGDLGGLESSRIVEFLRVFGRHPLRHLSLYYVAIPDTSFLGDVVSAFPTLRELTLLTEPGLAPWPGSLDAHARTLADLPHLVSLAWNNFALDSAMDAKFLSLDASELSALYEGQVEALAKSVRTLRRLRMTSVADGIVDMVTLGSYAQKGVANVVRSADPVVLHTSSWNASSGAFDDT